jgi:hypothetical protein
MTRPTRVMVWMLIFLAAVGGTVALVSAPLVKAFAANPVFNGLILSVLVVGILVNFRQVVSLGREVTWIEAFRQNRPSATTPRLLAPMAHQLQQHERGELSLSALSTRSLLDSIRSRLEEARDIARYMVGLLIFLGLLGTFWGLLSTVGAVGEVIGGLTIGGGDGTEAFEALKSGLRQPLAGMGTAFSSSLFGLAGALILGFLDLQAGHAQNRFFNELEEWLSRATRLSSGGVVGDADGSVPAYVQALLEQTADSLDRLQRTISENEQGRRKTEDTLLTLTEQLACLSDQMRVESRVLQNLAENEDELRPVLRKLAEGSSGALDEASRAHIRNLDVAVGRIHEDARAGTERLIEEFRNELRVLSRTIAALAGTQHPFPPGRS